MYLLCPLLEYRRDDISVCKKKISTLTFATNKMITIMETENITLLIYNEKENNKEKILIKIRN